MSDDLKPPETIEQLADWIVTHAPRIFVRVMVDNRWQNLALTEMPAEMAIKHVCRFMGQGVVPYVLKPDTSEDAGSI